MLYQNAITCVITSVVRVMQTKHKKKLQQDQLCWVDISYKVSLTTHKCCGPCFGVNIFLYLVWLRYDQNSSDCS